MAISRPERLLLISILVTILRVLTIYSLHDGDSPIDKVRNCTKPPSYLSKLGRDNCFVCDECAKHVIDQVNDIWHDISFANEFVEPRSMKSTLRTRIFQIDQRYDETYKAIQSSKNHINQYLHHFKNENIATNIKQLDSLDCDLEALLSLIPKDAEQLDFLRTTDKLLTLATSLNRRLTPILANVDDINTTVSKLDTNHPPLTQNYKSTGLLDSNNQELVRQSSRMILEQSNLSEVVKLVNQELNDKLNSAKKIINRVTSKYASHLDRLLMTSMFKCRDEIGSSSRGPLSDRLEELSSNLTSFKALNKDSSSDLAMAMESMAVSRVVSDELNERLDETRHSVDDLKIRFKPIKSRYNYLEHLINSINEKSVESKLKIIAFRTQLGMFSLRLSNLSAWHITELIPAIDELLGQSTWSIASFNEQTKSLDPNWMTAIRAPELLKDCYNKLDGMNKRISQLNELSAPSDRVRASNSMNALNEYDLGSLDDKLKYLKRVESFLFDNATKYGHDVDLIKVSTNMLTDSVFEQTWSNVTSLISLITSGDDLTTRMRSEAKLVHDISSIFATKLSRLNHKNDSIDDDFKTDYRDLNKFDIEYLKSILNKLDPKFANRNVTNIAQMTTDKFERYLARSRTRAKEKVAKIRTNLNNLSIKCERINTSLIIVAS